MKKLMAMVLAATLAFGSSVMVFADEAADKAAETVTETTEGAEVVAEGTEEAPVVEAAVTAAPVVEEEVVEEVVEEVPVVENVEFTGKSADYINKNGATVGVYPSFENNEALTKKIFELVNDTYHDMLKNEPQVYSSTDYGMFFTYEVEETLTAAKVEVNSARFNYTLSKIEISVMATYYVDKATNKEITAEAYAALLENEAPAEEAAAEAGEEAAAVEAVENVMLPLRAYAEALGYVVAWEDGKVTVSKDEATVYLVTGSTTYTNAAGEEVELEAPENIDGTLYVPEEFFTVVLGVEVSEDLLNAEAPVVEEEAVEEVAEEATEEAAEEETPAEETLAEVVADENAPVEGEEVAVPAE
ncbi:copper amine oxidase N-terminal domain-containing protein [Tyzzerella sp. OttesenSCG-928-J15]|nr:copper amine oxidase N-terminal domain-containing protein [Tyzzerella sp. OttesenSCG-928-J15]